MLFQNRSTIKMLHVSMDLSKMPTIQSARLIFVNGKGILSTHTAVTADSDNGNRYFTQIALNNTPLIQVNAPGCPTCSSLLATGYGIETAGCKELCEVQEKLHEPYISLDTSIEVLTPLFALLEKGLYVVADGYCYSTNGDGTFFWGVPNEFTENQATAGMLLPDAAYTYVSGQPIYLYPTQNTDCYDEKRVQHYIQVFKSCANPPRAIVYNFSEFINFILDGHHKACAAAILGIPLRCLIIIPCTGRGYHPFNNEMMLDTLYFSSIQIKTEEIEDKYLTSIPQKRDKPIKMETGRINDRIWEAVYQDSVRYYPTLMEYANMYISGMVNHQVLSDDFIRDCMGDLTGANKQKMKSILFILKNQNDWRIKQVAFACAKQLWDFALRKQAYQILSTLKNDLEVEQFFIDYLVDCQDKHDAILPIINTYWE